MKLFAKLVIIFILIFPAMASAETVKMAVFKLEPFMMEDANSKDVVGVTIDYWKEFIAPTMGVDVKVVGIFPIARATYMLEQGRVDVVSQLTRIPEREARFLYPETPLTSIVSCLVLRKDSPLKEVRSAEDLYGKTVGFIKEAYIPEMLKHPEIKLDLVTTTDFRKMNYMKLINNRIDVMLDINYASMKYWLARNNYLDQVKFIMLPVEPKNVYSIFRKTKEGEALRDAFEKANQKGIEENAFEKISERYLNQP